MASGRYGMVVGPLGRLMGGGTVAALGEGQLLERYATSGDEAAFEALVARHGPMVLGTCRRMLGDHPHDVDDAFQATFLVLARKAGAIQDGDRLGPWLHGVARKVAGRARTQSARRNSFERAGGEDRAVVPPDASEGRELRAVLDEELAALPEKYRVPLVLCYLDGLTHDEAASQLRWPVGTVRSRLAGGRDRLRNRLSRRGMSPLASVPSIAPVAALPETLLTTTVRLATTSGPIPGHVASLAKGALIAMMGTKLKTFVALGLVAGLTVGGAGAMARQGGDGPIEKQAEATKDQTPLENLRLQEERAQLRGELDRAVNKVEQLNSRLHDIEGKLSGLASKPASIADKELSKDLDEANQQIAKLKKLWVDAEARILKLQTDLDVKSAMVLESESRKAKPNPEAEAGPTAKPEGPPLAADPFGRANQAKAKAEPPQAEPASPAKPPTVLFLPGDPTTFAVISGDRDRVTMINSATKARGTVRLTGTVDEVTTSLSGNKLSLILRGKAMTKGAVFDRANHAWSVEDLGASATEVHPYLVAADTSVIGFLVKAPEIRRLLAFDGRTRKWVVQELAEPVKGAVVPFVTYSTVSHLAGQTVYIYSSDSGRWSAQELKRAMKPQDFQALMRTVPSTGVPGIVIPDDNIVHIYDYKTGDWAHIDTKDDK